MKKFTLCLLLGAVCLLAGCAGKNGTEEPTATVAPTTAATLEPTMVPTAMPTATTAPLQVEMTGIVMEVVPLGISEESHDWRIASEQNVFFDSIPVELAYGTAKLCMYVPNSGLADGEYVVELHVGQNRDSKASQTVSFNVRQGKPDLEGEKQYKDGYVLDIEVPYTGAALWKSNGMILKIYSSASNQRGSIYFGNLTFTDEKNGTFLVALKSGDFLVTAENVATGEKFQIYSMDAFDIDEKQLLTVTATPTPTATPRPTATPTPMPVVLFENGLAVSSYNNEGQEYNDWWSESEVCTLIAIPGEYRRGAAGATIYIRNGELKDGYYGLGVAVCENGDLGRQISYYDCSFEIRNGKLKTQEFWENYRKINGGYLIDLAVGFNCSEAIDDLTLCVKVYSNVTEKNGNFYFGNFYVVDELAGNLYLDLEKDNLKITSEQLRTGNKTSYQIVSMAEMGEQLADGHAYASGNKFEALVKKDSDDFYSSGLAIRMDNYVGKHYGEQWWEESEIQVSLISKFSALNKRLYQGAYGFSVFIPNGYLNDGQYVVEVFLCNRDGYESKYVAGSFGITNGIYDKNISSCTNVQKVSGGYVILNVGTYDQSISSADLRIKLKLHTTSTEENGELYITDMFIADAVSGFTYVDLSAEKYVFSANSYLTGQKENVSLYVKDFDNRISLEQYVSSLYSGEQFALKAINVSDLTFVSSEQDVADITRDGVITAKKAGKTEITVKNAASGAETTFAMTVMNPEVDVLVKKNQVVKGDTFVYNGKGLGVKETDFIWTSSNPEVGIIEKNTGKFTGIKEGTTTLTLTGKNSGLSYSFDVEVYDVKNGNVKDYITVVTNGLISSELERKITELLYEVYPDVFDYYADGVYSPITCNFVSMDGVAYTTGDREIYVSAEYINANPKDVDCITHELIHCAQSYPSGDIWLIEGITDYGRSLFGKYNSDVNWTLSTYREGQKYTDSYTVTAGFLKYVVEYHDENFVQVLNGSLKTNSYKSSLWEECTGYTIDALWAKYAGKLIDDKPTILYAGESLPLQLIDGYSWADASYRFSETGIVEISSDGVMVAKKEGNTRVTVADVSGVEASWEVTVKAPYIAPLVEKQTVAQGKTYQYVGMGYGIKGADFSWTSSNTSAAVIDAESGLLTAVSQGTTTLTMTEKNSGKTYSFVVEVSEPKTINPQDYIIFNSDSSVPEELKGRLYNLVCDVYEDVFDYFADGEYSTVTCSFGDCGGAAAYAYGDGIVMDVNFITSNPNDIDSITHELIHCAQSYSTGDNIWLIEGITDYGRSLFGRFNEDAGWQLQTYHTGQSYTDSYTVTGGFLKYVVENHNENMVRILNAAFKKNEYNVRIWTDNTGYTIDELWELYSMQ